MRWGKEIERKFARDGKPLRYPGNTVVSDVKPGNPAHAVLLRLRGMLADSGLSPLFILLPGESYHMTVIRGLNDRVRERDFWPDALDIHVGMDAADAYFTRAVRSVQNPGAIRMAFDRVQIDATDFRVRLRPQDTEQSRILADFRNRVADALGLRLPGHEAYAYHITLAYTLRLPEGEEAARLSNLAREMDARLSVQPPFAVDAPHAAYYDDMTAFSPARIARERGDGACDEG